MSYYPIFTVVKGTEENESKVPFSISRRRCILERIYDKTPAQRKPKDWKWMLLHLVSLLVPLIINLYLIYTSFTMFIPIMGRSGSTMNPDLIIGYKAVSMTLGTISFLCPLVMVMNR